MNENDVKGEKQDEELDDEYILERYQYYIDYYWHSSGRNKDAYKRSRSLTIILGATVTLISSLASASFVETNGYVNTAFAIATPILAALLTIVSGFAQNFHWGAAWRDMVLNASRLQKEKDRFLATKPEERDRKQELDTLNSLVIEETRSFFQRVLDSEVKPSNEND